MKDFNREVALDYDNDIRRKVLGYDVLQAHITTILKHELKENARVLVVGCGTGEEIKRLEDNFSQITIIGIDPSEEMLEVAKSKVSSSLIHSDIQSFEDKEGFDCVISVLVSHFIPLEKDQKKDFFQSVRKLLKEDGLLIGADLMDFGLEKYYFKLLQEKMGKSFFPIKRSQFEELTKSCCFGSPSYYFNSMGICGYLMKVVN